MQEGPANVLDNSPVNRHFPNGLPSVPHDRPYSGFTAVNGDNQRASSFRLDESANVSTMQPDGDTIVVSSRSQSHGWRPDDRVESERRTGPQEEDRPASNKRKRADSTDGQTLTVNSVDIAQQDGRLSPKRRQLTVGLDSAIDLTSPAETNQPTIPPRTDRLQIEPPQAGTHSGQRSPIAHGEPPPKPRPETEASIAESLQRYQQTQQTQQAPRPETEASIAESLQRYQQTQQMQQRSQPLPHPSSPIADPPTFLGTVSDHQGSPPDENQDEELANADGEDGTTNDPFDPKKRKRNFSNRTKTGCHTCRHRKKKCDEGKPTCHNCERGGFACGGYGPKPTNLRMPGQTRPVNLQAKQPYEASQGSVYAQSEDAGRSYSHWFGVNVPPPPPPPPPPATGPEPTRPSYPDPSPVDVRRPHTRDSWSGPPVWAQQSAQHQYHPPPDYQQPAPPPPPPPPPPQQHRQASIPPPPPQNYQPSYQHHPPPYLPLTNYSHRDPFPHQPPMPHYSYPSGPPTITSWSSGASHHTSNYSIHSIPEHLREKFKMLRGEPFKAWADIVLNKDRQACERALDGYNKTIVSGNSLENVKHWMKQILEPSKRPGYEKQGHHAEPCGEIGNNCLVHTPFTCEYGFNLHIGEDTILQRGCHLQDAATITIKERCIIGPDVKMYTMEVPTDCKSRYSPEQQTPRGGTTSFVTARAILIEDEVHIGGGAIIMPSVTIGRGAVVGAGSVVTKDVKEFTVVAGVPARFRRTIHGPLPRGQQHQDPEIEEQHDRMKKRMMDFANSGFNNNSPRII